MTEPERCKNDHQLTSDNIRKRRGGRAKHRECLTCYTDAVSRAHSHANVNRVRMIRRSAAQQGFTTSKNGVSVTITDRGTVVFAGTIDDAEKWVRTYHKRPGPPPHQIPESWALCVALFIRELQAAKRIDSTIQKRLHHLMMFARARPDLTPLTTSRSDIVRYLGDNDWSPRTAHSFRSTFRVFFRLLHDLEQRPDDPAHTLPAIKIPRSRPRPCPDHTVLQAFKNAEDPRVWLALKIAVETGMRRSEIAKLRPDDVEGRPSEFALHVVGKGGHERVIPISDDLAHQLLAIRSRYVFEGTRGAAMSQDHLGVLVARALPGDWTAHTLRHRFATLAYQATGDLRAVQELLGHASPTTTAIYTKVSDDSMRRAAMAAALG